MSAVFFSMLVVNEPSVPIYNLPSLFLTLCLLDNLRILLNAPISTASSFLLLFSIIRQVYVSYHGLILLRLSYLLYFLYFRCHVCKICHWDVWLFFWLVLLSFFIPILSFPVVSKITPKYTYSLHVVISWEASMTFDDSTAIGRYFVFCVFFCRPHCLYSFCNFRAT